MSKDKRENKAGKFSRLVKNPIILTVAITLIAVILFGCVTGIIIAVRNHRAIISVGGVRIEKSAAAYLATSYKNTFMQKYKATDTPSFWDSEYQDGKTYGMLLFEETEAYIREVAVGAYLFDRYAVLTTAEKKKLKEVAESATRDFGCKDVKEFNSRAEKMGFDYKGFTDALTLLYKKQQAQRRIFGDNGSTLSLAAYQSECEKYYSHYTYAKLLIIRTEFEYEVDKNGNYLVDEEGNLAKRPLTDEEYAERIADIEEVIAAMDAKANGTTDQITEEFFDIMLAKYDLDEYTTEGYFFSPVDGVSGVPFASSTAAFVEGMGEELLEFIYTLDIGEFAKTEVEGGVCFVYRGDLIAGAYASQAYDYFFSDFYSDAADYLYLTTLTSLIDTVSVKHTFYERVNVIALPYNYEFVIRSFMD